MSILYLIDLENKKLRDVQQEREVAIFKQVFIINIKQV